MKLKNISAILIWSGDYEALVSWCKDKLGLKVVGEINHPDDTGVGLSIDDSYSATFRDLDGNIVQFIGGK